MPSPKSKSKKTGKPKINPKNVQTVMSMFAKQKTLNLLKQNDTDDEDDFVQITKIESKSKYFKRKSSEMKSVTPEKSDKVDSSEDDKPSVKKRKLSLRKLSVKVENSSKSDDSVIVLSDSPVKSPTKRLSDSSNLRSQSSNDYIDVDVKYVQSSSSASKKTKLSKSKSQNKIKDTSVDIGHKTDSDFKMQDRQKDEISDTNSNSKSDNLNHSKTKAPVSNGDHFESVDNSSSPSSLVTRTDQNLQNKKGKKSKEAVNNKDEKSNTNELPQNSNNKLTETKNSTKSSSNNSGTTSKDKNSIKDIETKNHPKTKIEKSSENDKAANTDISPTKLEAGQSSRSKKSQKNGVNDSENLEEDEKEDEEQNGEVEYKVPYYLENFTTILNSVMEDECNVKLFNEADLNIIDQFRNLSENGKKLYVRLFSRKLQWFNNDKIKYPEICEDLSGVIQELIDIDFLHSESDLTDLEETLKILPAPKLKQLAKFYHVNFVQTKPQIITDLMKKTRQKTIGAMFGAKNGLTKDMLSKAKKHAGQCCRLKDEERKVFVRVLMLFSVVTSVLDEDNANGGQNQLFQMLMVNMGKVIYPEYTINKQTQIFPDRQHVLLYEKALQYEADMINFIEKSKWEDAYQLYLDVKQEFSNLPKKQKTFESKLPDFLRRYTVGHQLVKILSQGIEILQRRKDYHGAIELIESLLRQQIYCLDYHGYWWERRVLNLDAHLKKPLEALELVKKGMKDDNVRGGHRLALYQRAEKICNTTSLKIKHRLTEFTHDEVLEAPKTTVEGRIIPYSLPGVKHQFMTQDSYFNGEGLDKEVTMCNVEQVVLDYYKQDYPEGLHAEGAIISTLFSLFFWDILFMDVPDAFHSYYQTNPLDKMSLEFYKRRKTEIDDRLKWLENSTVEELNERSRETWENNCDKTCAGINWERLQSVEYIQGLIGCIGGKLISGILSRYAKDPRHTRSGFPDLTIWNTDNKTFKIVEVKGPGDRLSHKQILWLSYLLKIGVDAEVCHVKAVGAKKLKAVT